MISRKEATSFFKKENVNLVGTGKDKLVFGVVKKYPKEALLKKDIIPASVAGVPTDVIETGYIRALQGRTDKWRPSPGGVSIGHFAITAGTHGMTVLKDGVKMVLSNNHVLANSNDANIRDEIYQPGVYDGGSSADTIAWLHSFVPIKFGGGNGGGSDCWFSRGFAHFWNFWWWFTLRTTRFRTYDSMIQYNLTDCALAEPLEETDLRDDILDIGVPTGFGEVGVGDTVCKSGRTSAYTENTVQAINAYTSVGYGGGKVAYFEDQIITGHMLDPGDSGSVVLKGDKKTVIGLGFAGSNQVSIINRIANVRDGLGGFECLG